jgi:hypothetical protein
MNVLHHRFGPICVRVELAMTTVMTTVTTMGPRGTPAIAQQHTNVIATLQKWHVLNLVVFGLTCVHAMAKDTWARTTMTTI